MMKELEILIKMQEKDDVIGEKEVLTRTLPEELSTLKRNVEEANSKYDETSEALGENRKTQKLKELDIKSNNEKSAKYKNQLLTVKTNKEYKALNSEVSHLEQKNTGIDDELIALMEEEVTLKTMLEENKVSLEKAKNELQDNEEILKQKIDVVNKEIDKIREERNLLAKELPRNLVKRYASLIKNKNRKAVVFNDNNACSGCGFAIRPQQAIEIKEGNSIINCENCGRMLVQRTEE